MGRIDRRDRRDRRDKRPNGTTARSVERKFSLPAETSVRLDVHAACTGRRPAELVAELIETHLRRYVVSDRGGAGECPGADGRGGDDHGAAA